MSLTRGRAPISTSRESFDRHRLQAAGRTCRSLRHDLAAPLSAAALHLEVASRALGQLPGEGIERVRASVKISQREVEYAAWMIDVLSELARGADEGWATFPFCDALEKAISRAGVELSARGLRLVRSGTLPAVTLFGNADEVEQALTDLLTGAASEAVAGECRVSSEKTGAEAVVLVRVPVASSFSSPEVLFRLTRRIDGTPSGFRLFLARWTFESLGGRLQAAVQNGSLVFTVALPVAEA